MAMHKNKTVGVAHGLIVYSYAILAQSTRATEMTTAIK